MEKLQLISRKVNKIVGVIGVILFIIMTISCVLQVFFRFILNDSLSWSEELSRFTFIWVHLIGTSLLIQSKGHATVTVILDLLKGKPRKFAEIIISLIIFINGAIMLYSGTILAINSRNNLSAALSVPMWVINSSVAVGGLLVMIESFVMLLSIIKDKQAEEEVITL